MRIYFKVFLFSLYECLAVVLVLADIELIFFMMAMFWTCAEHCEDNIEMYLLLLCRAYTESLFCFLYCQAGEEVGGAWKVGRRYSRDR